MRTNISSYLELSLLLQLNEMLRSGQIRPPNFVRQAKVIYEDFFPQVTFVMLMNTSLTNLAQNKLWKIKSKSQERFNTPQIVLIVLGVIHGMDFHLFSIYPDQVKKEIHYLFLLQKLKPFFP
ncbi:MAG: hypothetical protein ABJB16_02125 [Saprospiraceae bacterium]